jgi:mRNA interferase MazF
MITSARPSSWPFDGRLVVLQAAGLPQPRRVRFKLLTLDERRLPGRLGVVSAADRSGVEDQPGKLLPNAT